MTTIADALHTLAACEDRLVATVRNLTYLRDNGALFPSDLARYNTDRVRLYGAQMAVYGQIMAILRGVTRDQATPILAQIPYPQLAPAIAASPGTPTLPPTGTGNPIVIAGVSVPVWAVVVLAIIVAVAVVAAVVLTAIVVGGTIALVAKVEEDTRKDEVYYETVRNIFAQCRAAGNTPAQCIAVVHGIRTPAELNPDELTWVKYLAIGGVAAVAFLGLITVMPFAFRAAGKSGGGGGTPRRYTVGPGDED